MKSQHVYALRKKRIVTATNNYAGNVYDAYNGGYRDHYIGNGMTMIAPTGVQSIITIFFH